MEKIYSRVLTIKMHNEIINNTHLKTYISGQCPWKNLEGKTNE